MNKDDRVRALSELQKLRSHVENTQLVLEDVQDDALKQMLCIIWTDVESVIEWLI